MLGRRRPHGKDLWNKLKAAVKTSKLEENQLRKYQSIQTQALHEAQRQLLDAGLALTDDDLADAMPRNDNGTLYSRESLVLRYGLRRHPGIVHAVQTLWDFDGPRDDLGCLVKAGYVAFYVRVAKLLDPAFDLSLATTTVEAEWEVDRKGCDALSYALFFDSMFQLADLWVESLEPADYVAFLDNIVASIFVMDGDGRRRLRDATDIECIQQPDDYSSDGDDEDERRAPGTRQIQSDKSAALPPTRDVELATQDRIPAPLTTLTESKKHPSSTAKPAATTTMKRSGARASAPTSTLSRSRPTRVKPSGTIASDARPAKPEHPPTSRNGSMPPRLPAPPDASPHDPNQPLSSFTNRAKDEVVAPACRGVGADHHHDTVATNTLVPNQPHHSKVDAFHADNQAAGSPDKHAISVRLVRFDSARDKVKQRPAEDHHVAARRNGHPKSPPQVLPSIEKSLETMRVGRNSFLQSALPHATAVASDQQPCHHDVLDDIGPWQSERIPPPGHAVVDETNQANTIRVQIQPTRRSKNEALPPPPGLLPVDDGNFPNKMRGGAVVIQSKASPTEGDASGDGCNSTASTSPPKASAIVVGFNLTIPRTAQVSRLRGTVAPVARKGSPPIRGSHYHHGQLDDGEEFSRIPCVLTTSLVRGDSPPCTCNGALTRLASTHSLPCFRVSWLDIADIFYPNRAHGTQSVPQLAHGPDAAAFLTINRRECTLERGQSSEKHVPNRIGMLKRKQKIHHTQNVSARLMDNTIVWDD